MSGSWSKQFQSVPADLSGYSLITVTHPYHGCEQFWLSTEQFQDNIRALLMPYWINGYTILINTEL